MQAHPYHYLYTQLGHNSCDSIETGKVQEAKKKEPNILQSSEYQPFHSACHLTTVVSEMASMLHHLKKLVLNTDHFVDLLKVAAQYITHDYVRNVQQS